MKLNPDTTLALAWQRLRQQAPFKWLVLAGVCLGIALLATMTLGGGFGWQLLFSVCIGCCCGLLYDAVYLLQAASRDLWRALRALPASAAPFRHSWAGVVPATATASLAGPPLGVSLAFALIGQPAPPLFDLSGRATQLTLVISLMATLLIVGVISGRQRLAEARAEAAAAERAAAENQLKLLQSQLEPHMLFNTLANLRVLIGLDAAAAQQMLDRLIAFLRATLEASRAPSHPLATEFARVADYLALMHIRMGPRLHVQLDLPPALAARAVPPLLLQPLVENAIKHGLEPHVAGGRLHVSARDDAGTLVLQVRDTGVGLADAAAAGTTGTRFGLAQVRERLATLHGSRASLSVEPVPDADGGTVATIRLPRTSAAEAASVPETPACTPPR